MTIVETITGDITRQKGVECIVNAANSSLQMGGGVAGAIRRGDPSGQIQAECDKHGSIPTGTAALTSAGDLPFKYVIHAVGPIWGTASEEECQQLLYDAYSNTLKLAHETGIRTIAFPFISAGIFGFPEEAGATTIPYDAVEEYIQAYPDAFDLVRFVSFH